MRPFDERDLIAYHMQELSPRRARALERALQTDASLAEEFEAYAATLRVFQKEDTPTISQETFAHAWAALRPSLVSQRPRRSSPSRFRWPALASAGLALAATFYFIATKPHDIALPRHSPADSQHVAGTQPFITNQHASASPTLVKKEQTTARVISYLAGDAHGVIRASQQGSLAPVQTHNDAAAEADVASVSSADWPHLPATRLPAISIFPSVSTESAPSGTSAVSRRPKKPKQSRIHTHREFSGDLVLAMGGTLISTRTMSDAGGITSSVGATHAVIAMAALHQQLHPLVGYRVAASYTRPDFTATSGFQTEVDSRIYEVAGSYVVQGPHSRKLDTAVEAGAGLMGFLPTQQSVGSSYNLRASAVGGVHAEYELSKHLAIHAAYRVQLFKAPDFGYSGPAIPVSSPILISNEPILGITYRFHPK